MVTEINKPFVLFIEFERPDGGIFSYGWKFYFTEDGAQQAFQDLYEERSIFKELKMKPMCKIKGCGMTSIFLIGANHGTHENSNIQNRL